MFFTIGNGPVGVYVPVPPVENVTINCAAATSSLSLTELVEVDRAPCNDAPVPPALLVNLAKALPYKRHAPMPIVSTKDALLYQLEPSGLAFIVRSVLSTKLNDHTLGSGLKPNGTFTVDHCGLDIVSLLKVVPDGKNTVSVVADTATMMPYLVPPVLWLNTTRIPALYLVVASVGTVIMPILVVDDQLE